jgi:hypothetical protein
MSDSAKPLPRALLIVPAPHGSPTAGDRVVLRRLIAFLEQRYDCRQIAFARRGGLMKSLNVALHLLPLELAPHWRAAYRAEVRQALAAGDVDQVFILHEGLFYLADEIDLTRTPVTLFAHNILSRFTIDLPVQPLFHLLSRRYEDRWYGKPGVRLVVISRGDQAEAARLGLAKQAPIAPPGAPPASPLAPNAVFDGTAVITGTYDWWRKRRDLKSFTGAGLELIAFDPRVAEAAPGAKILRGVEEIDWSAAIRVGVITDRFAGGFKLKSLEYVARNCLVFSRAPLFEEFEGLPHAEEFVVDNLALDAWPARIAALKAEDQADLRRRFREFKAACLRRYDWATALEPLAPG